MIRDLLMQGAVQLGIPLDGSQVEALVVFAGELRKWNRRVNLTAISDDHEIVAKHFLDSLCLAREIGETGRLLDIGSGAGFPAIPIKIARPHVEVVSVDAVGKKIHFQRHLARLVGLQGFTALHARVEGLVERYHRSFDIISSRAFSELDHYVRIAAPFLAEGGRLVAMKGPDVSREVENALNLLDALGFEVCATHDYQLPFGCGGRSLVVLGRKKREPGEE